MFEFSSVGLSWSSSIGRFLSRFRNSLTSGLVKINVIPQIMPQALKLLKVTGFEQTEVFQAFNNLQHF